MAPETNAPDIFVQESTAERVEGLAKMVLDIDEDYAKLAARVSEVEALREELAAQNKLVVDLLQRIADIQNQSAVTIRSAVDRALQTADAPKIAEELAKRVLVTRPASREEVRSGAKVQVVRQAGRADLQD